MLTPSMDLGWPQPYPMTLNDFRAFVDMFRSLEHKGPITIELRGGSVLYITGPDALKRRGKS
jgi:hypothetical protein